MTKSGTQGSKARGAEASKGELVADGDVVDVGRGRVGEQVRARGGGKSAFFKPMTPQSPAESLGTPAAGEMKAGWKDLAVLRGDGALALLEAEEEEHGGELVGTVEGREELAEPCVRCA